MVLRLDDGILLVRLKFSEENVHHFSPEVREFLHTSSQAYIDVCIHVFCVCVCLRV